MRQIFRAITVGTVAAVALLGLSGPALAGDGEWSGVAYPVYGWLPIYRTDTRLPEQPADGGGGSTAPEGTTSGDLNQAIFAGLWLQKDRFAFEGSILYAGLSGEVARPQVKIGVDAAIGDLRVGYEMVPDLYLQAGGRYIGLNMDATVGDNPKVEWKPKIAEPVLGLTYRPMLGEHWRLIVHGDVGGLITGDSTTAVGTVKIEWQPLEHLLLVAGGTVMYLETSGTIRSRDVNLKQTLYGPVVGVGIPF